MSATRAGGATSGRAHSRALDGVRAVAALSVLVYHAWLYTLPQVTASHRATTADRVLHELRLGLVLFFVLSGFLLYGPWVRAVRERGGAPRLAAYALRRAARIVPAYWLALAGSVLLLWGHDAVPGVRLPPAGDLWLFAVFGQNFKADTLLKLDPPMWTLAVEVSFYAALPLLGWLALRTRTRAGAWLVPVGFAVAGIAYNLVFAHIGSPGPSVSKVLPAVAPYFAAGMLAACVADGRRLGARTLGALAVVGAVLVVGDALWAADAATRGSHALSLRIWRDDPAAIGFALLLVAIACARRPVRGLSAAPVAWLGMVSYGVYLWHVPVLLALRAHGLLPLSPAPAVLVALVPTLAIAAASWHWLEAPAQRWARSRSARVRPAQARPGPRASAPAHRARA